MSTPFLTDDAIQMAELMLADLFQAPIQEIQESNDLETDTYHVLCVPLEEPDADPVLAWDPFLTEWKMVSRAYLALDRMPTPPPEPYKPLRTKDWADYYAGRTLAKPESR